MSADREHYVHEFDFGSEVDWFLAQGEEARRLGLYLPACLSLIAGIEASLRVKLADIGAQQSLCDLDPMKLLSNRLLRAAGAKGLPVDLLQFSREDDFWEKLNNTEKPIRNVEIVRLRHNLAHGNVFEFIQRPIDLDATIFTPDMLSGIAEEVSQISHNWVSAVGTRKKIS